MTNELLNKISLWKNVPNLDADLKKELNSLTDEELYDAFYKELEFGTAGLRGILGVGTNRMNKYIIQKTTKGFVEYLLDTFKNAKEMGVAISYDCRHYSKEFAKMASSVIASKGVKVYVFSSLRPTPELSFAVRYLKCAGGIMITASHNPPKYNGYKVYDETGCQLIPDKANKVVQKISEIKDMFNIEQLDFDEGVKKGLINIIDKDIDEAFKNAAKTATVQNLTNEVKRNIKVVYTPLHGTGAVLMPTLLKNEGYDIYPVPEQMIADPDFTTLDSPNPENQSAFIYSEKLGKAIDADLLLATDPDADRMGIAVKNKDGSYSYLTGNQTGALMMDYIAKFKKFSKKPVAINTIVTSNSGKGVCDFYGIELRQTLTGFKNLGFEMNKLQNEDDKDFFFAYEESYGYIVKDYVRDKDSFQSSLLLVEMVAYYKSINMTLVDALDELYKRIGYYAEDTMNIYMEGEDGAKKIKDIVRHFQNIHLTSCAGRKIKAIEDYDKLIRYEDNKESKLYLPQSLVIKYIFENGDWFIFRPSGTEPKLKIYISARAETKEAAVNFMELLKAELQSLMKNID